MSIPTQMSLSGFIATAPELNFGERGRARFHARAGIEQWRKEPDGSFTKLDPVFCDLVLFGRQAELAYDRFRVGDQFIASGYVHEYERVRDGHALPSEEFVARRIGHDSHHTRYTVERAQADPTQSAAAASTAPRPAVSL